ncbi:MAG TPA: adenylyl-sulfate kinase [Jatrophihabitantaceae bacterium]|jgi:adenylylsulfate kinase|nr:adenylyl-sulfate kinase [Jatrophihabitantaceae bacterium]
MAPNAVEQPARSLDRVAPSGQSRPVPAVRSGGATVWFTGLPSAGKTTIATALAARLFDAGLPVEILDGDAVRPVLSPELGYSRADRDANVARIGWVARLLARNGVLVLASVVSPFAAARDSVRALHGEVTFCEVHVATSVEVCAERDVKGLYAKQRAGGLAGLTGIDGEYEPPSNPELRLDTAGRSVGEVVDQLIEMLARAGIDTAGNGTADKLITHTSRDLI